MDDYENRKQAIKRYQNGEKISHIVCSLDRSRQWFYFWLRRYKAHNGKRDWYIDEFKAPNSRPSKVSANIEQQVIAAREALQRKRYAQTGAIAIQYEMHNQALDPPPVWTINRILSRHGLNKKPSGSYCKSNKDYPELFVHTHQMDLVGPRYIKGDGRFFTVNMIDTECHSCYVKPVRTKSTNEVVKALADFWTGHGMPDASQMDNELAFRGSNRHPRSCRISGRSRLIHEGQELVLQGSHNMHYCLNMQHQLKEHIVNPRPERSRNHLNILPSQASNLLLQ